MIYPDIRKETKVLSKLLFDFDKGDVIFQTSGGMGMDYDGNLMLRVSENMVMDMDSGEMHITSSWKNDEFDE